MLVKLSQYAKTYSPIEVTANSVSPNVIVAGIIISVGEPS